MSATAGRQVRARERPDPGSTLPRPCPIDFSSTSIPCISQQFHIRPPSHDCSEMGRGMMRGMSDQSLWDCEVAHGTERGGLRTMSE